MKIKFTGTGSGQTSLKRFHSSFVIQLRDYNLLVDTGDGISRALMIAGISFNSISAILYTHMHPDHAAGLPSLLVQMKMRKRKDALIIYCHIKHEEQIISILNNTHIYIDKLGFELEFRTFLPGGITDAAEGLVFKTELNSHLDDLKKNPKGIKPVSCGFLFSYKGKNIFYTGDISSEKDLNTFRNEKIDIMIAESTHIPLDILEKAYKNSGAEYLYLTHIGDDLEIPSGFTGDRVIILEDGFEIEV
jgi:ribonuclease BN (tRNA processing enzyme)